MNRTTLSHHNRSPSTETLSKESVLKTSVTWPAQGNSTVDTKDQMLSISMPEQKVTGSSKAEEVIEFQKEDYQAHPLQELPRDTFNFPESPQDAEAPYDDWKDANQQGCPQDSYHSYETPRYLEVPMEHSPSGAMYSPAASYGSSTGYITPMSPASYQTPYQMPMVPDVNYSAIVMHQATILAEKMGEKMAGEMAQRLEEMNQKFARLLQQKNTSQGTDKHAEFQNNYLVNYQSASPATPVRRYQQNNDSPFDTPIPGNCGGVNERKPNNGLRTDKKTGALITPPRLATPQSMQSMQPIGPINFRLAPNVVHSTSMPSNSNSYQTPVNPRRSARISANYSHSPFTPSDPNHILNGGDQDSNILPFSRGVFIRQLPIGMTITKILRNVCGGAIERIETNSRDYCSLYFVKSKDATQFKQATNRSGGIFWGGIDSLCTRPSYCGYISAHLGGHEPIKPGVLYQIENYGATRVLLIVNIPHHTDEATLKKYIQDQTTKYTVAYETFEMGWVDGQLCALARFGSIGTALGAKKTLSSFPEYKAFGTTFEFLPDHCDSPVEFLEKKWRAGIQAALDQKWSNARANNLSKSDQYEYDKLMTLEDAVKYVEERNGEQSMGDNVNDTDGGLPVQQ